MASEEPLEERIEPVFNPDGPNRQATEELIETISTVVDSPRASQETKDYAEKLIEAIKVGYEIQSGEKYEG